MSHPPYRQSSIMRHFSTLAGPLVEIPKGTPYTVAFKNILSYDSLVYRFWTRFIAYGAVLLVLVFDGMLFIPSHWLITRNPGSNLHIENTIMLICLALLQVFLLISTLSASRSTLRAKDPVPIRPARRLRVAFVTTRAPGEPVEMVRTTLQAAKRIRYAGGTVDVWLLDETNDPALKEICATLGVKHFSRAGVEKWNTKKQDDVANPYFAAKSKHGNLNSWGEYLSAHSLKYDIVAGVDTDQVPEPNYLERLLGYFRDPDVAFVVGPQVYGNYKPGLAGLVSRWAESQASFFQSTIQRAGNASTSAMFVGTNYAVRTNVLHQIGGFQPCITEDMATGLAIHARQNPETGNRWKSVYTPDVLAVGEGPDFWAPYFTQQWRWAAGTYDTWRRMVWRVFFKLSPKAMLHYFLMLTYYPMVALTWLLGIISSMIYLLTGATAILAPWSQFISLYIMTLVMQLSLYFWNRRFNVSPHEPTGSWGVPGMVLSALTAPIYLSALIGIIFGKKPQFVVTTKGGSTNPDWFTAFRAHLQWAALLIAGITFGILHNHHHPAMMVWVASQLLLCLTPVVLGMSLAIPERLRSKPFIRQNIFKSGEPSNV